MCFVGSIGLFVSSLYYLVVFPEAASSTVALRILTRKAWPGPSGLRTSKRAHSGEDEPGLWGFAPLTLNFMRTHSLGKVEKGNSDPSSWTGRTCTRAQSTKKSGRLGVRPKRCFCLSRAEVPSGRGEAPPVSRPRDSYRVKSDCMKSGVPADTHGKQSWTDFLLGPAEGSS